MKRKTLILICLISIVAIFFTGNINFSYAEEDENKLNIIDYTGDASFSIYTTADGAIYAMGSNSLGQLGFISDSSSISDVYVPTQIGNLPAMKEMVTSSRHVVGVTEEGHVYVWGNNTYGQLGIYGAESFVKKYLENSENLNAYVAGRDVSVPTEIVFDEDVKIVQAVTCIYNSYFLDENGNVWSTGINEFGQLGIGVEADPDYLECTPVKVKNEDGSDYLSDICKISCSDTTVFALSNDGNLYAWGSDFYGLLGDGESNNNGRQFTKANLPQKISLDIGAGNKIVDVLAKGRIAFIQIDNNELYFMGYNEFGQMPSTEVYIGQKVYEPQKISFFKDNSINIKQFLIGASSCFVLSDTGKVYAWGGDGGAGYLGLGVYDNLPSSIKPSSPMNEVIVPTAISFSDDVAIQSILGTAGVRTFVIDENGDVWAWGNNSYGQLGYRSESGEVLYNSTSTPIKSELRTDDDFTPTLTQTNYLVFPIIFICIVVACLIVWIIYSSIKTKHLLKQEAEYDNNALKRYNDLISEKIKRLFNNIKNKFKNQKD